VRADLFRLEGRVAIVTGASAGIGAATALALAGAGADVVIAARREDALARIAEEVGTLGRRAVAVAGDLSELAALPRLIEAAVGSLGRLDVLVNNVGGWPPRPLMQTSPGFLERAFHWNVSISYELSRLAVPHMLAGDGGSIINVSSAMSRLTDRGLVAYGTAKAALSHMTRYLAVELAPRIRVNAVAPGAIETESLAQVMDDKVRESMIASTPLSRVGQPLDVAMAILYLASPAAAFVTGKVLEVDGGTESPPMSLGLPDL
jgi:7-alpha-hydroxysteroid dehydrogenase